MLYRYFQKISLIIAFAVCLSSITACGRQESAQSADEGSNGQITEQSDGQTAAQPAVQADTARTAKGQTAVIAQENAETAGTSENIGADADGDYWFSGKTAEEITAELTLEQKVSQMMQSVCYTADYGDMEALDLGSVFGTWDGSFLSAEEWAEAVNRYQNAALSSDTGLPTVYGQDDVHGVNYCKGAVIFPHNIGLGAANDPDLMYEIGAAVGDEAKMTGMLWNFSPCVAVGTDPRWGRTYESYSSDPDIVRTLGASYTKGFTDQGAAACAKHFFADGSETWGTGEGGKLIDRGSAELTDAQIEDLLAVYQAQIDAGVQTIMLSYGKVNGVMMHENAEYIRKLREEMGFKGVIVTDYAAIQFNVEPTMKEKVAASVNAGVDMFMEPNQYREVASLIVESVQDGSIEEARIDEAVTRILQLKIDLGLLDDPMQEKVQTKQDETGSEEYRKIAERAVEESLVLLKNESAALPLKEGMKIYVTGPAADYGRAQCGGWTQAWQGAERQIDGVTTILQGLQEVGAEKNITILTDPAEASQADLVLLFVGEEPYAEWYGDSEDLELTGNFGIAGNRDSINEAKELRDEYGIPTAACIVAGRQVMISSYLENWDAAVMCYLPGTEGKGVANVLMGDAPFHGKLPMPWYESVDQIGSEEYLFPVGYGIVND